MEQPSLTSYATSSAISVQVFVRQRQERIEAQEARCFREQSKSVALLAGLVVVVLLHELR